MRGCVSRKPSSGGHTSGSTTPEFFLSKVSESQEIGGLFFNWVYGSVSISDWVIQPQSEKRGLRHLLNRSSPCTVYSNIFSGIWAYSNFLIYIFLVELLYRNQKQTRYCSHFLKLYWLCDCVKRTFSIIFLSSDLFCTTWRRTRIPLAWPQSPCLHDVVSGRWPSLGPTSSFWQQVSVIWRTTNYQQ